jgi:basic membrane protein A
MRLGLAPAGRPQSSSNEGFRHRGRAITADAPLGFAAATVAGAVLLVVATVASAAPAPSTLKARVAVVLQGDGCPPKHTVELCEGIREAARRTGVRPRVVAPTIREDLEDFLALTAQQDYDAIVLAGIGLEPAVLRVARRYPDVPFIVLSGSRAQAKNPPPNVSGLMLQAREAAFLAGWLAAKLEQRRPGPDVVGVVGGWDVEPVNDFVDGFTAGARRAAPRIKVLVDYSDDFVDRMKCAALARRQIARGAGVVFNVAGGCGLGTMHAAADAGVWAIGVDSDQSFLGPHVLTSVLTRYEAAFADVFNRVKAGRLRTGRDTVLTIRDGAAGLGRVSPKVSRPLLTQLHRLEREIKTGKLRVFVAGSD